MTNQTNQNETLMRAALGNLREFVQSAAVARPAPVLADEQLEFWGNFYVENNLYARGILFETFLRAPSTRHAGAVIPGWILPPPGAGEFYPLLPAQARVAERIGRCDTCGVVDHHLAPPHFLCAACAEKYGAYDYYLQGCAL